MSVADSFFYVGMPLGMVLAVSLLILWLGQMNRG